MDQLTDLGRAAVFEGVAREPRRAAAHGRVLDDSAEGRHAAGAGARVQAALPEAGEVEGAVGVGEALGATLRSEVSVRPPAGIAHGHVAVHLALDVRAAGRGRARPGGVLFRPDVSCREGLKLIASEEI